jgi:hypothetical protein
MMLLNEESRLPLPLPVRRAQPGPPDPGRAGRTWKAFLAALLRALAVAAA